MNTSIAISKPNKFQNLFTFKKFLAINFITIISWQSLSYGANIGISLIYTYIGAFFLFHIPNLVLTKYLLKPNPEDASNNHNIIYLVHNKLNYFSNIALTFCTWFANVIGYPSGFAFILSNLAYTFNYHLSNKEYFIYVIILYLIMSLINVRGFKVSFKFILSFSLVGVFAPMLLIVIYSFKYTFLHYDLVKAWLVNMQLTHPFSFKDINFGFILAIVMTIIGFEQTSLHMDEMAKHKFSFKKYHLFIASVMVMFFTIFMMLVLAYVTSTQKIDPNYLISGTIISFFNIMHYPNLAKPFVILFTLGEFGCTFAWMVHINRTFNATLLISKSAKIRSWGNNYTPQKLIKFELVVFVLYYILLKIFPALETSVILFNMSVQLSIAYYVILYLAILKEKNLNKFARIILFIGLISSILGVICAFIPNTIL